MKPATILRTAFLRYRGVSVGKRSNISLLATLSRNFGGSISIGEETRIFPFARLESYGGSISIGNNCTVNPFCVLYGHGGLTIGNHVRIATHTVIVSGNHVFEDIRVPICRQGLDCQVSR